MFLREERFDLVCLDERRERAGVRALEQLLASDEARAELQRLGLVP